LAPFTAQIKYCRVNSPPRDTTINKNYFVVNGNNYKKISKEEVERYLQENEKVVTRCVSAAAAGGRTRRRKIRRVKTKRNKNKNRKTKRHK
jgi:hypothetical protein